MVVSIGAQSPVDVDRLFHANSPSLSPASAQRPQSNQNTDEISEFPDGDIKLSRGPRHDEFDWSLTKVSSKSSELISNAFFY